MISTSFHQFRRGDRTDTELQDFVLLRNASPGQEVAIDCEGVGYLIGKDEIFYPFEAVETEEILFGIKDKETASAIGTLLPDFSFELFHMDVQQTVLEARIDIEGGRNPFSLAVRPFFDFEGFQNRYQGDILGSFSIPQKPFDPIKRLPSIFKKLKTTGEDNGLWEQDVFFGSPNTSRHSVWATFKTNSMPSNLPSVSLDTKISGTQKFLPSVDRCKKIRLGDDVSAIIGDVGCHTINYFILGKSSEKDAPSVVAPYKTNYCSTQYGTAIFDLRTIATKHAPELYCILSHTRLDNRPFLKEEIQELRKFGETCQTAIDSIDSPLPAQALTAYSLSNSKPENTISPTIFVARNSC